MSGFLLPLMNALQSFTNQGVVLAGGKIYTYVAGTTTPVATYTDSTLGVMNANPVILDSSGRPPNGIWVPAGQLTKFVVKTSTDVQVGPTLDYVPGINDGSLAIAASISALQALAVPAFPTTVTVNGYYTAGDGGGGQFYWDSTSTATADTGLVFQANGYSGTGRWIRLLLPKGTIDARMFGCVEGRTVNQNSDAFLAAVMAMQASGGAINVIVCNGTFIFDGTRWNYNAQLSAINNQDIACELQLGGDITFTNSASGSYAANTFYQPNFWSVTGIGGLYKPTGNSGPRVTIHGNWVCVGYGSALRKLAILGQTLLDGTFAPSNVVMDQVAYVNNANGNTNPACKILNKWQIDANECAFSGWNGSSPATPSVSLQITSTVQSGFTRLKDCYLDHGNITANLAGPSGDAKFYFKFLHENLNAPNVFDITAGGGGGPNGSWHFDQIEVADPQGAFNFLKVTGSLLGVQATQCQDFRLTDATLKNIGFLEWSDSGKEFNYSAIDVDAANWRPTQRIRSFQADTANDTATGFGILPGYVDPNWLPFSTTPSGAWATVAGGALDNVSPAYTRAATSGSPLVIRDQDVSSPAAASGDVLIIQCWVKRTEQASICPPLSLQAHIGGVQQTDGFGGAIFTNDYAPMASFGGQTWYYIYSAFKLQNAGVVSPTAQFGSQPATATLTISDVNFIIAKGNLNRHQVHQLAMSRMRIPSTSGAASGSLTTYIPYAPAPHMLNTDAGLDPRTAGQLGVFGKLKPQATSTAGASMNLPTGAAPTSPADGDLWREDNTNTGLKVRVNGVTKTVTLT